MPQYSQNGLRLTSEMYTNGKLVSSSYATSLKREINLLHDPAVRLGRRVKPASPEYLFVPTSYDKGTSRYVGEEVEWWSAGSGISNPGTSYHMIQSSLSPYLRSYLNSHHNFSTPDPLDPMNELIGKVRSEVVNFAQSLGEYKQTAGMITNIAHQVRKSYKLAAKGNITAAVRALGKAIPRNRKGKPSPAKSWLVWHFGVEQLAKDIMGAVEELQGAIPQANRIMRFSVRKTSSLEKAGEKNGNYGLAYYRLRGRTTRTLTAYVEIDNTLMKSAADHGLLNPLSLAYELTSASWFIDYVVNIGEWLEALDLPAGILRSTVTETFRRREVQFVDFVPPYTWAYPMGKVIRPPAGYSTMRRSTRTVRPLSAVLPQWKPSMGIVRMATALAFLSTLKVKKGPRMQSDIDMIESNKGYQRMANWLAGHRV